MAFDPSKREQPIYAGDLYGELALAEDGVPPPRLPLFGYLPGITLVGVTGLAAAWLSDHYGMPVILMGLLLGLALNAAATDPKTHAGLDLVASRGLRWGIVLLGSQITFAKIVAVGAHSFFGLLAIMTISFFAGVGGARLAGQSRESGVLAGGATAICGASAALALYAAIGKDRLSRAQFTLTLVAVALASALAMTVYPVIAAQMNLSDRAAGFLIGASIHDVAQAIGGGFSFSDVAGEEATIVKLARVTLLAPIVLLVSLWVGAGKGAGKRVTRKLPAVPWFIIGFLALVAINSAVALPQVIAGHALDVSKALLLFAVAAAALRSRLDMLVSLGWRAFVPVLCATVSSFLAALAFVLVFVP